MIYFTTYFDKNYLSRGLVLYDSIVNYCGQFRLYVLCLDAFTFEYFLKNSGSYPELIILSLNDLEEYDKEFKGCKTNRSKIEYYFTMSPCLPLFLLKKYNIPHICSLDTDMKFYSSPEVILSYLDKYSVLITPHNFSTEIKQYEVYGIYNVSFQVFKNDKNGLICLESWRKQCIDWCYDKYEDGKFADQKFLDTWITDFKGVCAIDILGIGVAPWNINAYKITVRDNQVYVNDSKLICYHFYGLRIINKHLITHRLTSFAVKISKEKTKYLYKPYINSLLSYKNVSDSEIERNGTESVLKTILFQKDWFYYKSGILFKSNIFIESLGKCIIYMNSRLKKWRIK